jgi:hypothetical protein
MKKYIILALGILMAVTAFSQTVRFTENFDGNTTNFIASPSHVWERDTNYYVSSPAAYLGMVPNMIGDVTFLETPPYDLSAYDYVLLRFKHICKISPQDIVRIEYKIGGQSWNTIPADIYMGNATNYLTKGFSSGSYSQWMPGDSLAIPNPSWWREETFDVSFEVGSESVVQFRFVIQHGTAQGTQISYGWLLDDIEIIASPYQVRPPIVEFITPFVQDTVYTAGTHTVRAKVKSQSLYLIQTPWLVYTATHNGVSVIDSVEMTAIQSDSVWSGVIPQFVEGTTVLYSITGKDAQGNYSYANSGYVIAKAPHNFGNHSAALISIDSPVKGQTVGGVTTPVIVSIRNRGDSALTSATIHWMINGVTQTPYPWTGNLAWDMAASVNLGNYNFHLNMYDTVLIWIGNNTTDPVLSDDTLSVIVYGCAATMAGNYTVGNGGVFSSVNDFLAVLKDCSPAGNITLLLQTGTYTENWDLSNVSNLMGNYTLTITSAAADADSVLIAASGVGITLANSNNLVIRAITVDATAGTYAIQFTGACTNVVIRDCKLLANSTIATTGGYAPIYKASSTGVVDNIFIINNLLDGGSYGLYFIGGTSSSYGQHIVFDSNTVSNQYYIATYSSDADFTSCSYNTILSRTGTTNVYAGWYGFYLQYINGPVMSNRIKQQTTTITSPTGIYLSYYNYSYTIDTGLIANNEIMLYATGAYQGIYASYTNAKILHNSIHVSGSGAAHGIEIYSTPYSSLVIKNNNIIMSSSSAYPIYVSATTYLSQYDMDYNNMYAPNYVGYAGGSKTTIPLWQQTVTTDLHSESVYSGFIDSTINLEMSDYTGIHCNILPDVDRDIDNVFRAGAFTSMGAYHGVSPYAVNATLKSITDWRSGSISGQTDSIKIQLSNTATDTITSLTLNWTVNGSAQTGISWAGSLASGQSLILTLGATTYAAGTYTIKAWISTVNGASDESKSDDTLSVSGYVCASPLNGTYTIGATGTFPSWEAALNQVAICGVNGDIVFAFQSGTYARNFDLSNNASLFGNHTLTLTSFTHNATDVTFVTGTVGITLNNSNNIIIKDVTIDATAGYYAVQFTGACTNIVIRDCRLLANPAATSSSYVPVYKYTSTGVVDSIFIINNLLDGGYYGAYFCAGTSASIYGKHVVFDSNTVSNQYYYGVLLYYTDFTSCANNTIVSRATTNNSWIGLYVYYSNGNIVGNHIRQQNSISTPYGINLQYYHYSNTTDTGLVANNEIIMNMTSSYSGINAAYTKARILHNSIYVSGSGSTRAIQISNSTSNYIVVKNNNIITEAAGAYPIYLSDASNMSLYDIDYNNMYAQTYIGYVGANKLTMADWRQTVTTDKNSIRFRPTFVNSTLNLELVSYKGLESELLPEVLRDKKDAVRGGITAMGCYTGFTILQSNAMLVNIQADAGGILGTSDSVKVTLTNMGTTPLTNATLNWSFNGVIQSALGVTWSGNLALGAKATVALGIATYTPAGYYTIKAWIHNLGSQTDMFSEDDTTEYSAYICPSPMNGTYTIGATGLFKTFREAMDIMNLCGVSGDVTLAFQQGNYNEFIDLSNISFLTGGHTLTLTSTTHNANDVVITTDNVGILLNNSNHIRIEALTIDARVGNSAIRFTGACTNITIRDCLLLADTTTSSNAKVPVYKDMITGIVDSIFIINNWLDGGYYGFCFYGGTGYGTGQYGTNVIFDSNIVSNSYIIGLYLYYTDFISCSYNTISSRSVNTISSWYGLRMHYSNGPAVGNRIKQHSTAITTSYGIYVESYNYYNTTDTGLISNNEIILYPTADYGINTYTYSRAEILHNSIYVSGTGAAGIYLYDDANSYFVVKNNNIVMESSTAYPIYLPGTTNLAKRIIDANNYYAPQYIGYAISARTSLTAWQSIVTTDINSVNIQPDFIDSSINLQLNDYTGFDCMPLTNVPVDIDGQSRAGLTIMGCYHGFGYQVNAMLTNATQWGNNLYAGTTETVKVELTNTALTNITNATIYWSFNNSTPQPYTWLGSLSIGQSVILTLTSVTFVLGVNNLDIWIGNLGLLQDEKFKDDSIHLQFHTCNAGLNGTYIVGATGMFTTIAQALSQIDLCGVTGDVTFALQPNTYANTNIDLTNIPLGGYTLTLTSTTHNAADVTIETTGTGILLDNSYNIIIKDLIIDASTGQHAIRINGACSNIVIRDCKLLANPTTTTNTYNAIYGITTGNNIRICNNNIDGGYYGIYLSGGSDVIIDSNFIKNALCGIYATSTHFTGSGVSFNTIEIYPRSTAFYGIYLVSTNGDITANRIYTATTGATSNIVSGGGIYVSDYNTNSTVAGLIANNEIRLKYGVSYVSMSPLNAPWGIKAEVSNTAVIHNSIFKTGSGPTYGIMIYNPLINKLLTVKNNNIYVIPGTSVVYGSTPNQIRGSASSTAIYLYDYNGLPAQFDIDYNNTYSGKTISSGSWLQITTDQHSISIIPDFVDTTVNLMLNDFTPFLCPFTPEVVTDITGMPRNITTLMGAYTGMTTDFDLMLQNITRMDEEVVVGQNVKFGVKFINAGSVANIDSATFRWSLNGVLQPKTYTWISSSPLISTQSEDILLDSFIVSGYGTADVMVWAETVNGVKDSLTLNDTLSKTISIVPLARFVAPFVADTINGLSFSLYVNIMEKTGALVAMPVPKMAIQTTMSNGSVLYDTVNMQYSIITGLWRAQIPQQYYGSTVFCSLTITDTTGNVITLTKSVYLNFSSGSEKYTGYNLGIASVDGLVDPNNLCSQDYVTISVNLINSGTQSYDFADNSVSLHMRVTTPNPFSLDTLLTTGSLASGANASIVLTNMFPLYTAGQYDIKIWLESSVDNIANDDTLLNYYISGKFGLPIDVDFSGEIPVVFASTGNNTLSKWEPVPQGNGQDTVVQPVFGTDMLSFVGSRGAMITLSTRQLDLSRTVQPSLSFWYFHDTLPSKDYTDVRVTEDGGQTYTTLFSLTKYNSVYGWKQYDVDLPIFANGQCVIVVFEAMEKSLQANTVQYIDRIRITAREDITMSEIIIPELTPCGLQNKELKVVMTNLGDIATNYANTPTKVTLEIQETGDIFTHDLDSGYLVGFSSDTITMATGFDFAKGTYTFKAYFSTLLDVNTQNDTFVSQPVTINPVLSVSVHPESSPANCLTGELGVNQTITLYNTGNMDLSNIDVVLQIDTGENNPAVYALFKERYTNTILAGDTTTYMFNTTYTVPWNARYYVRATAYLGCDSTLVNNTIMITECVDVTDLRIISIDNPFEANDTVGNSIQVAATLNNRSDYDDFPNARISVVVENSLREQTESFTETQTVGLLATVNHTFTTSYTVPDDSVYYLTVFVDSYDNYSDNDTITIRRKTVKRSQDPEPPSVKGIDGAERFTLSQNIPNPANNSTRIDYSIPEAGEVVFHIHSVSGQLLYSKTIEATHGKQSLELNTSAFAAGIYFYSIEYKSQRLVKRMMIRD